MNLNLAELQKNLDAGTLFVWRFKFDHKLVLTITDLAHGPVTFDLSNFSDFHSRAAMAHLPSCLQTFVTTWI